MRLTKDPTRIRNPHLVCPHLGPSSRHRHRTGRVEPEGSSMWKLAFFFGVARVPLPRVVPSPTLNSHVATALRNGRSRTAVDGRIDHVLNKSIVWGEICDQVLSMKGVKDYVMNKIGPNAQVPPPSPPPPLPPPPSPLEPCAPLLPVPSPPLCPAMLPSLPPQPHPPRHYRRRRSCCRRRHHCATALTAARAHTCACCTGGRCSLDNNLCHGSWQEATQPQRPRERRRQDGEACFLDDW
jgi:hypothetical protein